MKELYLHIGQPKTGTSALQRFFKLNRDILNEKGVCYPSLSGETEIDISKNSESGNLPVGVRFQNGSGEMGDVEKEFIIRLEKLFDKQSKILFSEESLWYESVPRFITDLRKCLSNICAGGGIRIKVIVYLRRLDELLESIWNQNVKAHYMTLTCDEFCRKNNVVELYRAGERLDDIAAVIGKENLIVRIYDQGKFSSGGEQSIFADFMSIFGITDISEFRLPDMQVNTSLNRNMVEIKRIINAIPGSIIMDTELRDVVNNINRVKSKKNVTKAPSFLSCEQRKLLLEHYEEENRKIGRAYFGIDASPFPPIDETEDMEAVNVLEPGEAQLQDIAAFFGQLLVSQAKKLEKLHCAEDEFALSREIPKGSRVVVYGASDRGRIVYQWIKRKQEYNAVGIVDRRFNELRSVEPDVRASEDIKKMDYDYVLIAVKNKNVENSVKQWLEDEGVEKDRIIQVAIL